MADLSDFAWGILDSACAPSSFVNWDRCAVGPRDALVKAGAAVKAMRTPAQPGKMGRKGRPAVFALMPTDAGRKMLAQHKAQRAAG